MRNVSTAVDPVQTGIALGWGRASDPCVPIQTLRQWTISSRWYTIVIVLAPGLPSILVGHAPESR